MKHDGVEAVPEILQSNLIKLKAAYRHPFEYINPRLYQKRKYRDPSVAALMDETTQAKFFVDNEEEFEKLLGNNTSQEVSAEASTKLSDNVFL